MSRVYRHYGCIKAGSCESERQNSLAGHLQGGRKWNKDPKTLREDPQGAASERTCLQKYLLNAASL